MQIEQASGKKNCAKFSERGRGSTVNTNNLLYRIIQIRIESYIHRIHSKK
jgi:hypothetical protein